jgi:hypothetical protein
MQVTAAATPNSIGAHAVDASKMAMSDHAIRLGPTARPFVECLTMRQSMKHTFGIDDITRNNERSAKQSQTVGPLARKTRGGRNFPGLQPGLGKPKAFGPKTYASRSDTNVGITVFGPKGLHLPSLG